MEAHEPTNRMLTIVIITLSIVGFVSLLVVRLISTATLRQTLEGFGVAVHKVTNSAKEIERKTFHVMGLLVPLCHLLLLDSEFSQDFCAGLCWCITICGWTFEILRLSFASVRQRVKSSFMGNILREKEQNQLTGSVFFALGCTLSISFFPPGVAMASILFLVLGDMAAALIGVSFGGDMSRMRIGRQGKKSIEGSAAMFFVCFGVGCLVFNEVHLSEYAVFVAALIATLTELYEPFGLNDNLTIPVVTSLALTWGLMRIQSCTNEPIQMSYQIPPVWATIYNRTITYERALSEYERVHMRL